MKTKRVVIREELVKLTGDWLSALVLNQFMYWSERTKDVGSFLKEENKRRTEQTFSEDDIENFKHGWIYKTAEELNDELMVGISRHTISRRIDLLVEKGWLTRRNNPKYKWDHTYQYRTNTLKIEEDLLKIGYSINGEDLSNVPHDHMSEQFEQSEEHGEHTIPEITTEITTEITSNQGERTKDGIDDDSLAGGAESTEEKKPVFHTSIKTFSGELDADQLKYLKDNGANDKWIELHSKNKLLSDAINLAKETTPKSPIGYITGILKKGIIYGKGSQKETGTVSDVCPDLFKNQDEENERFKDEILKKYRTNKGL
jgi:DNA-binding MarR family transcriptional regulator